eukprot:IDg6708t1
MFLLLFREDPICLKGFSIPRNCMWHVYFACYATTVRQTANGERNL